MKFWTKKENRTKLIVFLIRWWSIGAVYFFVGWGTNLGSYNHPLDFVLMLGIAIGLFLTFITHPVLRMLYNVNPGRYLDSTIMEKVSYRLRNVVASIAIVYLVTLIYQIINEGAIQLLGLSQETVFLPGEPILFATFYMIIYSLLIGLIENVKTRSKIE